MEYEADAPMRLIEIVYRRRTYDEHQRKREFQEYCESSSQSHVEPGEALFPPRWRMYSLSVISRAWEWLFVTCSQAGGIRMSVLIMM